MLSRKRYSLTLGDDLFEPINLSKKKEEKLFAKKLFAMIFVFTGFD